MQEALTEAGYNKTDAQTQEWQAQSEVNLAGAEYNSR